ncbi:MAG: tRNA (adenosine(37)-N6)-dimethylallyltransferase MiaA [Chitinophagales bacterium]
MASAKNKTVIIIVGATAVGKTGFALELANYLKTEIISADSRQCYKELNIGVARPSEEELRSVKHHFIASHSIHDIVNAGTFEEYALQKTNELFQTNDTVIMAGGTGLYIKAFAEGMDEIRQVPGEVRKEIILNYENHGLEWLQKNVQQKDPEFFKAGEIQNPHRLMRALEVVESTGQSILEFRKGKKGKRDFNIVKIGLELPKEELHGNINARVDKMIEAGLVEEVKSLVLYKNLNALQTVGYSEIFDYLDEKYLPTGRQVSLAQAIELIKKNTRQYAKRQMTWFKKDKEIKWYLPSAMKEIKRLFVNAPAVLSVQKNKK